MRERIISWLNTGANVQEGVHLMEESGAPSLVLRLIKSNPLSNKRLIVRFLCDKYKIEDNYSVIIGVPEVSVQRKVQPFREEFPFLNRADCPIELETLASRKFARYHAYVELHKNLNNCTSLDECATKSKELIDNYIDNRSIWNELHYYQQHNKLLGKHPIFLEFRRRKELLALPVKDLVHRQQQISNNIWRVKNELSKKNKPHLDIERKARLASYEAELNEVNRLLN